jgi:hypothetical protein
MPADRFLVPQHEGGWHTLYRPKHSKHRNKDLVHDVTCEDTPTNKPWPNDDLKPRTSGIIDNLKPEITP